jgi:hypothetical protein
MIAFFQQSTALAHGIRDRFARSSRFFFTSANAEVFYLTNIAMGLMMSVMKKEQANQNMSLLLALELLPPIRRELMLVS